MLSLQIAPLVDWFLNDCQARGLSPKTVTFYKERLASLCADFGDREAASLTPIELKMSVQGWKDKLSWSVTTTNHCIVALRVLFGFLEQEEVISQNPTAKLKAMKAPQHIPKPLQPAEITALLDACGKDFAGIRNKTILLIFLDCGLRLSECVNLQVEDVDLAGSLLTIRYGKGGKSRVVPFSAPVRRLLLKYAALRQATHPLTTDWWVGVDGESLGKSGLESMFDRLTRRAKVKSAHLHRLRHTFAFLFLSNGGNPAMLQRLLGHSDMEMTARYSHIANLDATANHRQASPVNALLGHRYRG